jgi:hypothetical protein
MPCQVMDGIQTDEDGLLYDLPLPWSDEAMEGLFGRTAGGQRLKVRYKIRQV